LEPPLTQAGERTFKVYLPAHALSLVEVLNEELFQLEIDRLRSTIPGDEYDSARQALEGTVKRAMARAGTNT
jgi:hypothetical protein